MVKTIYKITKHLDPNTIYISATSLPVEQSCLTHKHNPWLADWWDDTCYPIVLATVEVPGTERATRARFEAIKYEWVVRLKEEGYNVLNHKDGRTEDREFRVETTAANNARYKESGQQKVWSDQRHPDYCKWQVKICREVKVLGLTSKEYRELNGIPEYSGPKKR